MKVTNQQVNEVLASLDSISGAELGGEDLKRALEPVVKLCMLSTKVTCKVFFPGRFYLPFSGLHDEVFEALDNDLLQKLLILAPRRLGKTSMVQLGYSARNILFQLRRYIVPISCSQIQSMAQTESLKLELLSNSVIRKLFGSNIEGRQFSKEQWETSGGICVMPRGAGQQIRGLLYRDYRPDLLLFDDVEDPERIGSEEYRADFQRWFYDDALKATDIVTTGWKCVMLATMLHEDSAPARIMSETEKALKDGRKPDWHVVHLAICDENFQSNWEEAFPTSWIKSEVELHRERRMMDSFAREFMNLPVSGESNFSKKYFQFYKEPVEEPVETVLLIDPARSLKPDSAETAIVVVGVSTDSGRLYVREVIHGRLLPNEVIDHAFAAALRWKARVIGFEVTGLNEFITYPMKNEMLRRGLAFELVELKARGKKEDRIAALLPFYRQNQVYHNELSSGCRELEIQLLSYPRSRRWDIMDAFSYIVELLESGSRYFIPRSWTEKREDVEKEYAEIGGGLPELDDSWMVA